MMTWQKTVGGEVFAVCNACGRAYNMASEWDVANLDWHECQKEAN